MTPRWHGQGYIIDTWQVKNAGYTAQAGDALLVDTSAGAVSITLPAVFNKDEYIKIADYMGTFNTNNLTIVANGHKIMRVASDMTVSTSNVSLTLVYIDAIVGVLIL